MTFDCDVLIAGGGPTGMAAALGLLALGRTVHIIDKHATGLDFSRAILVNSSTLAALAPFGVADAIAGRGRPVRTMAFCGPSGPIAAGPVEGADPRGRRPILLPQLETEACLREALARRGATVERPCELVDFMQDGDGVTATLLAGSTRRACRARYLIGADGFHGRVREALGVPYRSFGPDMTMWGADVVMTPPFEEDVRLWMLPQGAGMALRLEARKLRLAGTSQAVFDALDFAPLIEATTWESEFAAHFAVVERYGEGRVWLAGDAAHVHSPVGGRGMNMGIADGLRLARALHDDDFEGYARESRDIADNWVRTNHVMTAAVGLPGTAGRLLRLGVRGALHAASLATGERLAQIMFERVAAG
jgi:2-polyprenyl-6-methoxyphenol hydroxylase-like FAD-dependent oxidoreductase